MAAFMGLPLFYALMQSLKPLEEIFIFPPRFFVINPTLENFAMIGKLSNSLWVPFSRYVSNSIYVSVLSTFLQVFICSMAAYILSKSEIKGRKVIFSLIVLTLMFSYDVTAIPQYVVLAFLGLIDTHGALILPAIAAPLGLFLMKQYMETIPNAMIESAKIDGAGHFKIYWNIIMPMVKPAWLTLVIFAFRDIWNREGVEFIYSEQLKMLPTMLRQLSTSGLARAGMAAASAVLLLIPPITTFIITQSNVIKTMAHSGIK